MAIRPPAAAATAANINCFIFRFLCFCPEPPGAVPWLVQNHSTICLSGGKYRPFFVACQRGKQKIIKIFYWPFLSVPGMPQRGNPLFYWVLWVFHPPPSPPQIFFARRSPAPRPSLTRAGPPASGHFPPPPSHAKPAAREHIFSLATHR